MSKLSEFLTNIANAIRNLKGTTEPINAQNFANEINSMKEALDDTNATPQDIVLGKTAYVKGQKVVGTYKTPTSLKKLLDITKSSQYLFYDSDLTDVSDLIQYSDTSNVTNMSNMFKECRQLETIPPLDTSNVTNMSNMFYQCASITTIPPLDTSNVTNMSNMFFYCSKLLTVPLLDMSNVKYTASMFSNCVFLTNLTLLNIKVNVQIGDNKNAGSSLTLESLLGVCQECINVGSSRTLTVGSYNMSRLSNVYVKLTGEAEEDETLPKLPMVQCESTDEGAMTITQYMVEKNWSLA